MPSPAFPSCPQKPKAEEDIDTSELPSDFLVGYAPGQPPEVFEPGQAKLIRAGSDIILQVHYTTNGKPEYRPQPHRPGFRETAAGAARVHRLGHQRDIQDSAR